MSEVNVDASTAPPKALSAFAADVLDGLSASPKHLSSKYFYDDAGSKIFQEIMNMPEYYPTDCETEILQTQAEALVQALGFGSSMSIVELGAGDGAKTVELLHYLLEQGVDVTFRPIDISRKAVELCEQAMHQRLPELKIASLVGDYFKVLSGLNLGEQPALFLFLGGNMGNYEPEEAQHLLWMFQELMREGDKMLIGFDLKKHPHTILRAYNDPHGITARFNLNLLQRINRELGGNFDLGKFDFYPFYDPRTGEVRSWLVSLEAQTVTLKQLETRIHFEANELIATELSKKYGLEEIQALGEASGLHLQQHFLDQRRYFSDSLFEKRATPPAS